MGREVNRRRGAARRQAIIDAAIELWAETGWRGTGITAVAERAGVSHSGLLHHFGSKDNLLFEVIAEWDRRNVRRYDGMFQPGGLDTLRQIPEFARSLEARPGRSKLFTVLQVENLDSKGPAHEYFVARQRFILDLWAEVIRTGQARGEIRPDVDPQVIASQINAFTDGAPLLRHLNSQVVDLVSLYEHFTDRLIDHLTAGTGTQRPASMATNDSSASDRGSRGQRS